MADGRIPSFHVVAGSIPEAFFRAMEAVWHGGMRIRTQYDRVDSRGSTFDPPSRDARVLIEVTEPFAEPRYPRISFCEIGKYIAELMGAKDHLVVPLSRLKEGIRSGKLPSHWPYTYHQRLAAYPLDDGTTVDQIARMIHRIVESPISRRAVATTRLPAVDAYLAEDLPCLGEVQIRCPRADDGTFVLHMDTRWRSRDLYKAWCDNAIALTFLQQVIAAEVERRTGVRTRVGSYADYSTSLHIVRAGLPPDPRGPGARRPGLLREVHGRLVRRAGDPGGDHAGLAPPQLSELLAEDEQWKFTPRSRAVIEDLIEGLRGGRYRP